MKVKNFNSFSVFLQFYQRIHKWKFSWDMEILLFWIWMVCDKKLEKKSKFLNFDFSVQNRTNKIVNGLKLIFKVIKYKSEVYLTISTMKTNCWCMNWLISYCTSRMPKNTKIPNGTHYTWPNLPFLSILTVL